MRRPTAAELVRFVSRIARRRRGERRWEGKRLGLKIVFSVWVRQFFTLAAPRISRAGVPAIYVNYLDYDVFAHAFGPAHPVAIRALRRLDRSIRQLARIVRRLPELRYDLYICSDHGQALTRQFGETSGGRSIDEVVRAILAERTVGDEARPASASRPAVDAPAGPAREKGLRQRFFNHAGWPGFTEVPRDGTRVIAAGPNAFVYFLDSPDPLLSDEIERRYPGVLAGLSTHPGIGLVLVRSSAGASCWWRGRLISLEGDGTDGPFAARADRDLVLSGLRDLMAMPSAGDIVLYGIGAARGDTPSFRSAEPTPAPRRPRCGRSCCTPRPPCPSQRPSRIPCNCIGTSPPTLTTASPPERQHTSALRDHAAR